MLKRTAVMTLILISISATTALASAGSANYWVGQAAVPYEEWGAGIWFGARPGYVDGYDGQSPINLDGYVGVRAAYYRTWSGSPAFYHSDYESPIPAGGSKTWSDIYLWSQNYTPRLGTRTRILMDSEPYPPSGYWGRLFLDYVPDSLGWTGPWQFDFRLDGYGTQFDLPVPITSNPYDPTKVTRMHLTVYTTPIPEPSSLLALVGGLGGLAIGAMRRRRRRA